jgi:hypothetical protein
VGELLPGQLIYVFFVSIVDACLLSWLALIWYRRSVRRLMLGRASEAGQRPGAVVESLATTKEQPAPSLSFSLVEPAGPGQAGEAESLEPRGASSRLVIAYCVGAAIYSSVVTAFWVGQAGTLPFVAWVSTWWSKAWPIVPTLVVLLALDRRTSLRLAGWYVVAGCAVVAGVTLVRQVFTFSFNSAPLTNMFWMVVGLLWDAWIPLVLVLITGWRRVRAVTPLALASTLLFGFGLMVFREALTRGLNLDAVRSSILDMAALTSVETVQYGLYMLVSLPVGWVAWRLLQALAGAFERKRFSDIQLMVDCWWIVVVATEIAMTLSISYGLGGVAIGVAAFAAYRTGVAVSLRGLSALAGAESKRLLLLRVFGYQARTEALFDRIAQRWRFFGPVQLIGGADLAMRTADPGDVLAFVSGRLDGLYVASIERVAERVDQIDTARDPDGRFRVNEVYCRDDTWRATLEALLDRSDTVLMDLRSFSNRNAGCIFELEQLMRRVPTDAIVLVCDSGTDLRLLGEVLSEAWTAACRDGRGRGSGEVALVKVEGHSARELGVLVRRLRGIVGPQRSLAPTDLPAIA